jgi:VanZ family protein
MTNKGTDKLKQLHHILWKVWDIWNDIAIANHLVVVHRHKRRNIRLSVRIVADKEGEKH